MILLIFFFAICFSLCSCTSKNIIFSKKNIIFDFEKTAIIKSKNFETKCLISRTQQGVTNITVTSPETIKDLEFNWLGNSTEMSLLDITSKTEKNMLPNTSTFQAIVKILNHASHLEAEHQQIKSTVDGIYYCIKSNKENNQISYINVPTLEFKIIFSS
jgi:hypothetical protein